MKFLYKIKGILFFLIFFHSGFLFSQENNRTVITIDNANSTRYEKDKDTGSEEKSGDDISTGEPTKDTTEPEVKGDSIDVRAKYSKLLNILFESTLDEAENGLS